MFKPFLPNVTNRAIREAMAKNSPVGGAVAANGGNRGGVAAPDLGPFISGLNIPFTARSGQVLPVLNANIRRRYLYVQNQSLNDIYVSFSVAANGLKITAGGSHEFVVPSGIHSAVFCYVLTGVADSNGIIIEGAI